MQDATTPMMQQYQAIRRGLPADVLLFFRLGDFYEMFFEDARIASSILNVSLTKRGAVPMCGVPHHAAESYIARLIKAGRRVAVCDQTADAIPGKLVPREVTRIISAGTVSEAHLLDAKKHNYIAAVHQGRGDTCGFAFMDLSTGDFQLAELPDRPALDDEIARLAPAEILCRDDQQENFPDLRGLVPCDAYTFLPDHAEHALKTHFAVHSLDGFGCRGLPTATGAAGALLHHLQVQLRRNLAHVRTLRAYQRDAYLVLDTVTQANLEIVHARGGGKAGTLLHALDRTKTPMGARLLRDWLLRPLRDLEILRHRQQAIADLIAQPYILHHLRESLATVKDIERTLARLSQATGNPRDIAALKTSLEPLPDLLGHIHALPDPNPAASLLHRLAADIDPHPDLTHHLARALADEPPIPVKDGGIFRDGFNPDLDTLRAASRDGKGWIATLQQQEIEKTGIKSLKIGFNAIFGYYIEITKPNIPLVPPHYHRKQTTASGERYITPELKDMEGRILGADERARHLEFQLFQELRQRILQDLPSLQRTAAALAALDTLASLAETARLHNYCRPVLEDHTGALEITAGRHPVLDQNIGDEKFVPNDTRLDIDGARLALITGPNMAGKSTYIRQVALLALLAHTGSHIPADSARIGLMDRIFTRVGASDDLSRGQSTFMVEMNETANIINHATDRSLVILDEIGRGTSTFDGLAIAWSVAEWLHDTTRARTLFATHYHEITDLAAARPGIINLHAAVREWNDQIIFLRKILPGPAEQSFGIQVARLAGLPPALVERAKIILRNLEESDLDAEGRPAPANADPADLLPAIPGAKARRLRRDPHPDPAEAAQMRLF